MADHKALTDPEIHEPKGAAALTGGAADLGKTYLSDGAGSGTWAFPSTVNEDAFLSLGKTINNVSTTGVLVLDTYYPIQGTWTEEHVNGMTTVPVSGIINVAADGDYSVNSDISMISSRSNAIVSFSILVNDLPVGPRIRRKISTGGDVGALPIHAYLPGLIATDAIRLGCTFLTGEGGSPGDTVTVENGTLSAELRVAT